MLIVGGEGLFPPSPSEAASKVLLSASEKFANALKDNLASPGASANVYINKQRDRNFRGFAAKILAHKLHHALLQVDIASDDKGDLYIKPVYSALELQSNGAGPESYRVLPGLGFVHK